MKAMLQRQETDGGGPGMPPRFPGIPADSPLLKTGPILPPWFGHDFSRIPVMPSPSIKLTVSEVLRTGEPFAPKRQPDLRLPPLKSEEASEGTELLRGGSWSVNLLFDFPNPIENEFQQDLAREKISLEKQQSATGEPGDPWGQAPVVVPGDALKKFILKEVMLTGKAPTPLQLLRPFDLGKALWTAFMGKSPDSVGASANKTGAWFQFGIVLKAEPEALTPILSGKGPDLSQLGYGFVITAHPGWKRTP